jgi:hypothetical protein
MRPVYALNALRRPPRAVGSLSGVMMKDSYSCVVLARLSPRLFAQAGFSFFPGFWRNHRLGFEARELLSFCHSGSYWLPTPGDELWNYVISAILWLLQKI